MGFQWQTNKGLSFLNIIVNLTVEMSASLADFTVSDVAVAS